MSNVDVSVVIGFRDWGAERIRRSAQSIFTAFDGMAGEVIISDYGSEDPEPTRVIAQELGAKHVYTPGDPVWSRSRALNAGFAVAEGQLLISTDADMLFSPRSMRRIVETAREAGKCALFLQCRDLPDTMGDDFFAEGHGIDWDLLEREGRLRPRWGMGGMMAISAQGFTTIRGFDERLHTYGGEDLDFAQRARRAGYRTVWVDDPDVRMYHMWHPPTLRAVEQTEAGKAAVAHNRNIVYNDKSYVRNVSSWPHAAAGREPLVSVVYATRGRAELLGQSLRSVLTQSVQDFEVIVVDDGPEDDSTLRMVESFRDPRLRYIRQERKGISAARNLALDHSRGSFTAVMDDDDLMPPKRLEWQLEAITPEFVGSGGSFLNFDDETGERQVIISKNPSLASAVEKGGAPGHGTWMLRTDVMRTIRYDEAITSGVDNNFFLRLLRSGYKVSHCGKPVLLRRLHRRQVTAVDSTRQGDAARQALRYLQFGHTTWHASKLAEDAKKNAWPKTAPREDMLKSVEAYLPDHLVTRDAFVNLTTPLENLPTFDGTPFLQTIRQDGTIVSSRLQVCAASYQDLVTLAALGTDLTASISDPDGGELQARPSWVLQVLAYHQAGAAADELLLVDGDARNLEHTENATSYTMEDGETVRHLVVSTSASSDPKRPTAWLVLGQTAEEYWA